MSNNRIDEAVLARKNAELEYFNLNQQEFSHPL